MTSSNKKDPFCGTIRGMASPKQVKVSERAFMTLKEMARDERYKGRGVTGVIDQMLFNEFTTAGSGRPFGTKSSRKKVVKKG